jgi:hypothetical protein
MLHDYFSLENQRSELLDNILNTSSNILNVFHFFKYFSSALRIDNPEIQEAFLKEFINDYLSAISGYEVWGIDPDFSVKLLQQLKELAKTQLIPDPGRLNVEISRIEEQFKILIGILNGNENITDGNFPAYFPLIEKDTDPAFYGIIDSVTIRISRASNENKFIIVPSEKISDQRIITQCVNSWQVAFKWLKFYVKKPYNYHEVIINFEKKEGFYEGNSLGIALTISFLDQLLKFYNPVYSIKILDKVAFTGAVNGNEEAISVGNDIIRRKVKTVFFSEVKTFVFPKTEEKSANEELKKLKEKYPTRKLKLIPIEDMTDILSRRNIIDIRKRNILVRTGRLVKKNWISAAATILLAIILTFLFRIDFDDNPSILNADMTTLFVKNKNDKILWTKKLAFDPKIPISDVIGRVAKIVDINSDGENEVIIRDEIDNESGNIDNNKILRCYGKNQKVLWNYSFYDKVSSNREKLNDQYIISFIDTLSIFGKKCLFLISSNCPSFSSAIYRIDLKTGKKLPGAFWTSGHIQEGFIKDIDKDNIPEIIGTGYDNGFEDLVFFAFKIDSLNKVRPTTEEYLIKDYPPANMIAYIRFPKSDFDNYMEVRTPSYMYSSFRFEDNVRKYKFGSAIPSVEPGGELGYDIDYNFKDIDVNIISAFRVRRDTLVAHRILKPPYTDTQEYRNIIKSNILYWKNGKWVKRNELD